MSDSQITKVEEIQVGDFVRYHGGEAGKRYSYTGEVVTVFSPTLKKDENTYPYFEMLTFDGTMGFVFNGKEEFELYKSASKPAGWAKFKKNPTNFLEKKEEEAVIVPAKTKKDQVFDLVAANPRKKADALLKLANKEIGGSVIVLSNYIKLALSKN